MHNDTQNLLGSRDVIARKTTHNIVLPKIKSRTIFARIEELEEKLSDDTMIEHAGDWIEHAKLGEFMESMAGRSGDEKWRGQWYPSTLPYTCIDWDSAHNPIFYLGNSISPKN